MGSNSNNVSAHDISANGTLQNGITTSNNGFGSGNLYGANPPPAWSNTIGPTHKAPPAVATQLVVPTELSDGPVTLTCFSCQEHITTRTKAGPSTLSWALCGALCIFLCWPCCLIPFCCPPLNVTEHYCSRPSCGILLGKYKGWKK